MENDRTLIMEKCAGSCPASVARTGFRAGQARGRTGTAGWSCYFSRFMEKLFIFMEDTDCQPFLMVSTYDISDIICQWCHMSMVSLTYNDIINLRHHIWQIDDSIHDIMADFWHWKIYWKFGVAQQKYYSLRLSPWPDLKAALRPEGWKDLWMGWLGFPVQHDRCWCP